MELRDYQVANSAKCVSIIKQFGLAYLAAEVRTGKTFTALDVAYQLGKKRVLFVTKKNAISTIENDFKQTNYSYGLRVINYESLKKIPLNGSDFVIVDEAHSVGAFPKPTKRFEELREYCRGRDILLLSGTPSPESYSQLYHQFNLSDNSPWVQYPNFYKWARVYVEKKIKYVYNRELTDYSGAREAMVKADIDKYMVYFSQKDAGFNQVVQESIQHVPMDENIYRIVNILKRDKVYPLDDGDCIMTDTAVKMQSKFHQLFSGTVKTEAGKYLILDHSKVNHIKRNFAGKKIAIFYKFISEGEMIKMGFPNITNDPFVFRDSGPEVVFSRQFISGREAINLSAAEFLIFINIDFSALSYLQSKERINTKDREGAANVVWLFSKGGIEEKIYPRVQNKRDYTAGYFLRDFGIHRSLFAVPS